MTKTVLISIILFSIISCHKQNNKHDKTNTIDTLSLDSQQKFFSKRYHTKLVTML